MTTLIRGVRLYGEGDRVDVLVTDGQIAEIGAELTESGGLEKAGDVVDATGRAARILYAAVDEYGLNAMDHGLLPSHHQLYVDMAAHWNISREELLDDRYIVPAGREFRPNTLGMMAAAPYIDRLLSARDLRSLEEFAAVLSELR